MDDKDVILAEQKKLIERQQAIIVQQQQAIEELRRRLTRRIEQLEDEIARLKKNSSNSSTPLSVCDRMSPCPRAGCGKSARESSMSGVSRRKHGLE